MFAVRFLTYTVVLMFENNLKTKHRLEKNEQKTWNISSFVRLCLVSW